MRPGRALALSLVCALRLAPASAEPVDLPLPAGATATDSRVQDPGSALVAGGAWANGAVPGVPAEGRIAMGAWRVSTAETTLALMMPYRQALTRAGFTTMLDCATDLCGGFDFRYAIPVLAEPAMHVDLGDFRYLSARRDGAGGAEYVAVLVSRSNESGFVQILTAAPSARPEVATVPSSTIAPPVPPSVLTGPAATTQPAAPPPVEPAAPAGETPGDLAARLAADGRVALDDLAFTSGSAELSPGDYASLNALAAWLSRTPDAQVTLVGHTDAQGSLAANVALSKRRAESVRARLIAGDGGLSARISAEGAGYLAPRASNLTDEGRQKNRRVEVILTPTR